MPQPLRNVVLLRKDPTISDDEIGAMRTFFELVESRLDLQVNDRVVGRLSVLPYYKEVEGDVNRLGAKLINSYSQHRFVADLWNYVGVLEDLTPPTYLLSEAPYLKDDPAYDGFVLKGETNSKKFLFSSHMHARSVADISRVQLALFDDSLISTQAIYVRRKERLKTFFFGPHDLPITNEYRVFVAFGTVISVGFYWSSYSEDISEEDRIPPPVSFLAEVVEKIEDRVNFYAVDVALTEDGRWIVIEVNDGQCAGISDNDPWELYENLADQCRLFDL